MTDVKVRPPLRPLHFVAPILLVGAHIYYLHSQYERVTGLFIRTGGSTADMTSWTAAFATSLGYCFVVGVLVKMLGKKVTSKNADGKEQTTLVGPVLYDPREAMVVSGREICPRME